METRGDPTRWPRAVGRNGLVGVVESGSREDTVPVLTGAVIPAGIPVRGVRC